MSDKKIKVERTEGPDGIFFDVFEDGIIRKSFYALESETEARSNAIAYAEKLKKGVIKNIILEL